VHHLGHPHWQNDAWRARKHTHTHTSAMHRGTPRPCRAHAAHMQRTCRATVNNDSADDSAIWQDRISQGLVSPHLTPAARVSPLRLPWQSPCRSGDESVYVPCLSRGRLGEAWWAWPSGLFVCNPVARSQACNLRTPRRFRELPERAD
jgi:hypothetical protein